MLAICDFQRLAKLLLTRMTNHDRATDGNGFDCDAPGMSPTRQSMSSQATTNLAELQDLLPRVPNNPEKPRMARVALGHTVENVNFVTFKYF